MRQNRYGVWVPTDGPGSAMEILRPIGAGDISQPYGTRSVVWVNGTNGEFVPFDTEDAPPGDNPTTTFTFFPQGRQNFLERMANAQDVFHMQKRLSPCYSIDNPTGWRTQGRVWHYSQGKVQSNTNAAAPTVRAGGALIEDSVEVVFLQVLEFLALSLTTQTTTETENLMAICGLSEKADACGGGYPGPDKMLFIGGDADTAATANVLYSVTGGGTWAAMTNDPFAANEHIQAAAVRSYNDGFRLVVGRSVTDAGNPPEIAYATAAAFDATTVAALTWTTVNIGATNAEFVTAIFWPELNRLYVGLNAGDIYLSTNQGESFTRIYDGSTQINAFASDKFGGVWAVGATNTILYESANNRGVFTAKVGPSGGGTFYSIAIAYDGKIYAGNGQSLYKNNNDAKTAGAWTTEKDFGSGKTVQGIVCEGNHKLPNGDSEIIRVLVDGTSGAVWDSVDGGNSFQQVTNLTNTGYNDWYVKRVGNGAIIVGDASATPLGTIHLLS